MSRNRSRLLETICISPSILFCLVLRLTACGYIITPPPYTSSCVVLNYISTGITLPYLRAQYKLQNIQTLLTTIFSAQVRSYRLLAEKCCVVDLNSCSRQKVCTIFIKLSNLINIILYCTILLHFSLSIN
jgi:hypothetical protein